MNKTVKTIRNSIYLALIIVGLMSAKVPAQVNVEDEASSQTPFELLWGFDTGG